MPFLDHNNARIYYEVSGEAGTWVTLINGHTRSSKDFKLLAKHLAENGKRVLVFDNRGSGQTVTEKPFTFEDMANDVLALWEHLGVEVSHVLGISMGGMMGQLIAAEHPDLVYRLILVSTSPRKKWVDPKAEEGWGNTLESVKQKLQYYFAPSFLAKNKLLVEAMSKQILKEIEAGRFAQAAKSQREAMSQFESFNLLSSIRAETMVIHGKEDRIMMPAAARELHEHLRHSRLVMIEGAGHLLLAEAPQELYAIVTDFLSESSIVPRL